MSWEGSRFNLRLWIVGERGIDWGGGGGGVVLRKREGARCICSRIPGNNAVDGQRNVIINSIAYHHHTMIMSGHQPR